MTAPHVDLTVSPHVLPAHVHSEYALDDHTHAGYAASNHTHSGYAVTTHTHPAGAVLAAPRTVAYGAALTGLAPLAGVAVDVVTATLTGNPTVTPAAGTDGQILRLRLLASGGQRVVTFASAVRTVTGVTDRTVTIPSGQVGVIGLEYLGALSAWALFSRYVTS